MGGVFFLQGVRVGFGSRRLVFRGLLLLWATYIHGDRSLSDVIGSSVDGHQENEDGKHRRRRGG